MKKTADVVGSAKSAFNSGRTKSYEFRRSQLKALLAFITENEKAIVDTLVKDSRKSISESQIYEIDYLKNEIKEALYNLKEWMRPEKVKKSLAFLLDTPLIQYEPYGVVLILAGWNFPFLLTLSPLIGAIAAGNAVVIKPSDVSPLSAGFIEEHLPKYLEKDCFQVFNGDIPATTELLKQKFDYIFYTGGTEGGRIIYQAAARNLTPVTLELGGKNPAYLDDSADVEVAANRIMWGKCVNAGQACVGVDYLLCSEYIRDKFIQAAKESLRKWYGDQIEQHPDFGRIVNEKHFSRIQKLLEGQQIALGGKTDASELFVEPTVVINPKPDDPIMTEEIFGPILPIYTVASCEEAIEFINQREKPLAIYVFSTSKQEQDKFLKLTSSGGICINDVMMQFACDSLPFGGVGNSGIGAYHGKFSFETFSHRRGMLIKKLGKTGELIQNIRYPPYTEKNMKISKFVTQKFHFLPNFRCNHAYFFVVIAVVLAFLYFYFR